jgi:3-deoxy-manno-octulosonate cytidylyltransferase (CMP-KDO synthetase)
MVAFTAIVPARLASTRLPRKPLADLHGLPMVVRVAQRAQASGAARVVVAADSGEIVDACKRHGVQALLTSPAHPTGTDRLAEAAALLHLPADEIVVNVQGDEPLMPPATVAAVARLLQQRSDCGIATAAHPLHEAAEFFSPNVVKVVTDHSGRALLFSRAYRAGFLRDFPQLPRAPIEEHESLEQLRALWHGVGIAVLALDAPLPPGVDTPADLELVRKLLAPA